jgi:hypothetical protein
MSDRYLLHMPSGVVYIYAAPWIDNPEFVEVADAKGTPLKAARNEAPAAAKPVATKKAVAKKKPAAKPATKPAAKPAAKKTPAKAETKPAAPAPEEQDPLAAALSEEASRGLPK